MKYNIEDYELPVRGDDGIYSSYRLDSSGNNLKELLDNAVIAALDQLNRVVYADKIQNFGEPVFIGIAENAIFNYFNKEMQKEKS